MLVPRVGLPSEVFVCRHIACFGDQVRVIGKVRAPPGTTTWGDDLSVDVLPPATPLAIRIAQMQSLVRYGSPRILQRGTNSQRKALLEMVEERGCDTVLAQYLDKWVPYLPDLLAGHKRVFGHAHGYDVSMLLHKSGWARAYKRWNSADGIIVPSEVIRQRLVALGIDFERIHVIPSGVEVPSNPPERTRSTGGFEFIAVGRLVPKKSPLLTLKAFESVWERVPQARLNIVGDGPLRGAVEQYVTEQGLSEAVTLWGAQPHGVVRDLLARADGFVQHSRTDPETGDEEGLPAGILEAMAYALPVVATRHAGIPEAIAEEETGFLVDEGDADAMSDAMLELMRAPEVARSMGLAGWRRAAAHFSVEQECESLRRLLLGP